MKKSLLTTRASSRRISRNKKLFATFTALVLLAVLFMIVPALINGIAKVLVTPVDALTSWVRDSDNTLPTYLRDRDSLNETIKSLEQKVAEKSNNDLTLAKLQKDNAYLQGLLATKVRELVLASVIARPPELPYDLLMVDQGTDRGVVVGAPVFIGQDQLIGVVAHATADTAYIELITSPSFESTVYIYGPDIFTKAEGYGGGVLRVRVPQGIDLSVGNIVIVPALNSAIYGTISHIQTSPTQPEQYGFVVPTIPLQSIHKVAIGGRPIPTPDFETVSAIVEAQRPRLLRIDVPSTLLITTSSTTASSSELSP